MKQLNEQVVIRALSGIGLTTARMAAKAGAKVVSASRSDMPGNAPGNAMAGKALHIRMQAKPGREADVQRPMRDILGAIERGAAHAALGWPAPQRPGVEVLPDRLARIRRLTGLRADAAGPAAQRPAHGGADRQGMTA